MRTWARAALLVLGAFGALSPVHARAQDAQKDDEEKEEKIVLEARPLTSFWQHLYEGDFRSPGAVFYDPWAQEVLVCDTGNDLVGIFDRDGLPVFAFGRNEHLRTPVAVAADRTGRIYVLDADRKRIKLFSYRGEYLSDLELPGLPAEMSISTFTIDLDGNLFLAEGQSGQIFMYDRDRKLRLRFSEAGDEPGQTRSVAAIASTRTEIVVIDHLGTAVQVFDRRGNLLRSWGEHAMGTQNFSLPSGVAVDQSGHVLVVDALRHDIKVFDSSGKYLDHFGGLGTGPGEVAQPSGIAIDETGRMYVAEKLGNRVQVLELAETLASGKRRRKPIVTPGKGNWRYAVQPPQPGRFTR
jgi:DNA-binding beta-propeller fold protein YncE